MNGVVSAANSRRKGQPIRVFGALLLLWCGARAVLWQSPFPMLEIMPVPSQVFADAVEVVSPETAQLGPDRASLVAVSHAQSKVGPVQEKLSLQRIALATYSLVPEPTQPPMMLTSHQLLWMSALASVPVPPEIAAHMTSAGQQLQPATVQAVATQHVTKPKRWSFDSWLFLRPRLSRGVASGPLPSTYGASQAGAVMRYRLAPGNLYNPSAYARATQALAASKDTDIAIGFSARPLAKIPITAQAEMRASRLAGKTEIRPAAFVVTEFTPKKLPLGARVSAYGQAGYVGGKFATAFADGQVRIDREISDFDLAKLRAGAGVWGGAQRGAARLDIGPTASADIKIGKAPARLSMDYRHRVAGDAEPQSGLAITLSTGF